jgi:dipeptidase E
MTKIVAVGGAHPKRKAEPFTPCAIDQELLRLVGKPHPRVLFIPTASSDDQRYIERMREHFNALMAADFDVLCVATDDLARSEIEQRILRSDLIYVGGGNTLRMMKRWRRLGVDTLLAQARARGAVLAGTSAGSICWFNVGNSDSRKSINPAADYIKVKGLGFIDALHCPHYDSEHDRQESLKRMMAKTPGIAIALDDNAAFVVIDAQYKIISAREGAQAYKIYWHQGAFYKEALPIDTIMRPLAGLLRKGI